MQLLKLSHARHTVDSFGQIPIKNSMETEHFMRRRIVPLQLATAQVQA